MQRRPWAQRRHREARQRRVRFALGYDGRAAEETWGGDKAGGVLFVGDVGQKVAYLKACVIKLRAL